MQRRPARTCGDKVTAPVRLVWRKALHSSSDAHYLAGGVALGTFFIFYPIFFLHFPLVWVLAHFMRVSKLASCAVVAISNPFTVGPITTISYLLGALATPGDPESPFRNPEMLLEGVSALGRVTMSDLWTLLVGSVMLSILTSLVTYWMARKSVDARNVWLKVVRSKRLQRQEQPVRGVGE